MLKSKIPKRPGPKRPTLLGGSALDLSFAAIALCGMAAFAVVFAKERLYADGAYFLIQVIKTEGFHVINGRWLIPLIQWSPLTGVHLGLPMEALIVLVSLANVVLAAALYLFVVRYLRDHAAGMVLLATQFVGLTHALFCPIFEFYYGAMLLVVFVAVLRSTQLPVIARNVLLGTLFVLIASSHFMGLLTLLFVLTLERIWQHKRLALVLAALLVLQLAHRLLFLSEYESDAFKKVFTRLNEWGLAWIFAPGRLVGHGLHALAHYPDTVLLASVATIALIRLRDVRSLVLLLSGLFTMYVLTSLFFPDATHGRYREIVDYAPTVWTLMVIALRVMAHGRMHHLVLALLSLIFIYRMVWSVHVASAYTDRVAWMEQYIEDARSFGIRRGIVLDRGHFLPPGHHVAPLEPLSVNEALLLSACQGPEGVVVLVPMTESELRPDLTPWLDAQLATYGTELPTDPNGRYFHMPRGDFQVMPLRTSAANEH